MTQVTSMENELAQAKSQIKGLIAQLDAAKQMVNEGMSTSLQLRTNMVMFQQAHQEQCKTIADLKTEIEGLRKQVEMLELLQPAKIETVDAA